MNIHLPAILGFTRYQGFDPSIYMEVSIQSWGSSQSSSRRGWPWLGEVFRLSHGHWGPAAQDDANMEKGEAEGHTAGKFWGDWSIDLIQGKEIMG